MLLERRHCEEFVASCRFTILAILVFSAILTIYHLEVYFLEQTLPGTDSRKRNRLDGFNDTYSCLRRTLLSDDI